MDAPSSVPLKQCSRKEQCVHPESSSGWLPATRDYFAPAKRYAGGLFSWCRACRKAYERARQSKPEVKKRERIRRQAPKYQQWSHDYHRTEAYKERQRIRDKTPKRIEWVKEYRASSEYKQRQISPQYKEYRRKYRQTPKGQEIDRAVSRRYSSNHPEVVRLQNHRRRSRQYNLPNTLTIADWQRALDYFDNRCAVCGKPAGLWHVLAQDHWIPLTDTYPDNPGTVPTNIVPMCHSVSGGEGGCNNLKLNKDPIQWLVSRYGERKAKEILKRIQAYFEWVRNQ